MNPKSWTLLMILSSLALAGLLALGFGLALAQETFYKKTRVTPSAPGRNIFYPSLSADGTKIAFQSDADFLNQGIPYNQSEIWLYDTTTMTLTRVTTASDPERSSLVPSLSADGTKLAFASDSDFLNQGIADNQLEIWLYDTTTMTLTRVTTDSDPPLSSFNPSLNADGTKIAFSRNEIWLYDATTMTLTQITSDPSPGRGTDTPSLSADGTKIAFQSNSDFLNQDPSGNQIWLFEAVEVTGKIYLPVIVK